MNTPELSIVIPALNEAEALPDLIGEIAVSVATVVESWEVLVIDDGSTDRTFEVVQDLATTRNWLRAIRLRRNFGKAAALSVGFEEASGDIVITLDGDGQDDPADIPLLLAELDRGYDLVSGWKRDRQDPFSRRLASRVFNYFSTRFTEVSMHDMNCGFKAYRGECARSLDVYGELHRYLPALAAQDGWRVTELPVNHRARRHGRSRYGLERYRRGAFDLLTVLFLGRYRYRPLHLFGGLGVGMIFLGLLTCLYLTVLWLGGDAIGDRPLLILGVLLLVMGGQLFTFGLLAQMVVVVGRQGDPSRRPRPSIAERTVSQADLSNDERSGQRPTVGNQPGHRASD